MSKVLFCACRFAREALEKKNGLEGDDEEEDDTEDDEAEEDDEDDDEEEGYEE